MCFGMCRVPGPRCAELLSVERGNAGGSDCADAAAAPAAHPAGAADPSPDGKLWPTARCKVLRGK